MEKSSKKGFRIDIPSQILDSLANYESFEGIICRPMCAPAYVRGQHGRRVYLDSEHQEQRKSKESFVTRSNERQIEIDRNLKYI